MESNKTRIETNWSVVVTSEDGNVGGWNPIKQGLKPGVTETDTIGVSKSEDGIQ